MVIPDPAAAGSERFVPHLEEIQVWCVRRSGDCHLAEDVVQEVALAVLRKGHQLRDPGALRPWLFRVAQRRMVDELRRRHHTEPLLVEPPVDPPVPVDDGEIRLQRRVRRAVGRLPPFLRHPVRLHYFQGRSLRDIAESLDTTVGGVKARLHRARSLLRERSRLCPRS